jgi:hypothetical protein
MLQRMMKCTVVGLAVLWTACSSGGKGNLTAGDYQLAFTMAAPSTGAPVNGVDMTIRVPDDVQVATDANGKLPATALSIGNAVSSTSLIVGQYASATRQLRLSFTTPAAAPWNGEFARLKIAVPQENKISESTLVKSVAEILPGYKVVGVVTSSRSTVSLTESAKTTVSLVH